MATNAKSFREASLKVAGIKQDIKKFLKQVNYIDQVTPDVADYKEILKEYFSDQGRWDVDATYLELQMYDFDKKTVKKTFDILKKHGLTQENYHIKEPVEALRTRKPKDAIESAKKCYLYTVYVYIPSNSKDAMTHLFFDALLSEGKLKAYKEHLGDAYEHLTKIASSKQK